MKKKLFLMGMLGIILAFGLVVAGCDNGSGGGGSGGTGDTTIYYYVSATGSDANDGLSSAKALADPATALTKIAAAYADTTAVWPGKAAGTPYTACIVVSGTITNTAASINFLTWLDIRGVGAYPPIELRGAAAGAALDFAGVDADGDGTYDAGTDKFGHIMAIADDNTVTMGTNLTLTGANYRAVYVYRGCTFTMNGGTISGNGGSGNIDGAGVYSQGTFIMNGGTISGNSNNSVGIYGSGGGVYSSGTFIMNGGTISGNTARIGGGVYSTGTFTMNGGTISGNTASDRGGGVYNGGDFTMAGGTISGNTASNIGGGGVYVYGNRTFTKTGGTIYGSEAANGALKNVVTGQTNKGAAVFVYLYSNITSNANADVHLENTVNPGHNLKVTFTSGGTPELVFDNLTTEWVD